MTCIVATLIENGRNGVARNEQTRGENMPEEVDGCSWVEVMV
jgi:hypothetical protein